MKKSPKLIKRLAFAAIVLSTLVATAAEANITYTVDLTITSPLNGVAGNPLQTDSVVGSVTTDGTIGILHAGNLVDWNLNLNDVTNPANSIDLTTANSLIPIDLGSVLNADATNLYFNFSGTGIFAFQANNPGAFSGYHYWCLSNNETWACLNGDSIAPGNVYAGNPGDDLVEATGATAPVGNQPLNPPSLPSSVPEPSTIWLLGLGLLAGAGYVRRRG
jgi:hypothetical protein